MLLLFPVIICLLAGQGLADIEQILKDTEVIPDILKEAPKETLKIVYDGGLITGNAEEFTPTATKDTPTKLDWTADDDAFYTVIMINPDIPSREMPTMREVLHWLVVNIPGKDLDKGEVLVEYFGPGAPKSSGLLRYVFLVYKQPEKLEFDEPKIAFNEFTGRPNFSAQKFSEKYNLGSPVAGNIFQAKWDEYVPIILKRFGVVM